MITKRLVVLLVTFFYVIPGVIYADEIRIALRSHQDADKSLEQWQPTADYLSRKIPEHRFTMVPFVNISAMNQAISSGEFHFSLSNPSSAIEYIVQYNAEPLATLVNKRQGKGYSQFGSVIFTRADRHDINLLKDLKGKTFVAVDEQAFGGWRVSWLEFLKNDINPFTDFKALRFAGGKQEDVVFAVLYNKAEAGTVRTDMLERMAASNEIKLSDFKILGEKRTPGFPFIHSTDLYPEWLFSTASNVNVELKNRVKMALFSISVSDPAAQNGKYVQWIKPLDYTPVDNLLKKLSVGPYNVATMDAYTRFYTQYGTIAVATVLVILLLTFATLYLLNLNRQIIAAKDALNHEISLRQKMERELFHSQRIESLGSLAGGIAHNFNNSLASITGFCELALSNSKVKDDESLSHYLSQILTAGDKCTSLVNQMMMFSRSDEKKDKKEELAVSTLVKNSIDLFQTTLSIKIQVNMDEISDDLYIHANDATISQLLINIFLNAKDAIAGNDGEITVGAKLSSYESQKVFCDSCHQAINGEYIDIYFTDSGGGIGADEKAHIFEPFYSTKDQAYGAGMGLSVVHGIVHELNGHIIVDSVVNKGTTFHFLLPKLDISNRSS